MDVASNKLRILIVEDEGLVAMMLEQFIDDAGHEVTAVVSQLDDALAAAGTAQFDLAILDVNLCGKPSYAVADLLLSRGIPFAFATGYGREGIDAKFVETPILRKPFALSELERLFSSVISSRDSRQ